MKRFFGAIKRFFVPAPQSSALRKIIPYFVVAFIVMLVFVGATYTWEATNAVTFCGLTCHTMPPQYITQQHSSHANVSCEDCHLGRDVLAVMIPRKIEYSWQTGSSMITNSYRYPIIAKNMRPARDACENCHEPSKFASDKLVEINRYADDINNTITQVYLLLKTGGGTSRQGLGKGIHWHIENPVYFYATDKERQVIPYILVTRQDGTSSEYIDTESGFDPKSIKKEDLQVMDCITCHNRTAHGITNPSDAVDSMLSRGLISSTIPEIHKKAVEILSAKYDNDKSAMDAISGLTQFYQTTYADFYSTNSTLITQAISALKDQYSISVFPDQKMFFDTHPDNIGHKNSPGCFRCHDGKHVSPDQKDTVRLECNLCHSVPTVALSGQLVSNIPVEKGTEPDTHTNPNWINLHRTYIDSTCSACHTVEDAGGVSNTSFCSNSICHGSSWKFAGFDAPKLREIIKNQLPTPTPEPTQTPTETTAPTQQGAPTETPTTAVTTGPVTFDQILAIFKDSTTKCTVCHGSNSSPKGVNLTSFANVMKGGTDGAIVIPNDPANSILVKIQEAGTHPGKLSADQLALVKQWIAGGALEK